ncbi:MAG: ATP-binding protein [Flavipsychrobacter sp.]
METILNWSSGKDAALAYYTLQNDDRYNVSSLLTTVNQEKDRVVMHGVRKELLLTQADRMNMPITTLELPPSPSHDVYSTYMSKTLTGFVDKGVEAAAFGDIFLEDLKKYREEQLSTIGLKAVFPLWKKDTRALISIIEEVGIDATVICVDGSVLGKEFLGRKVDRSFMNDLPEGVDPCGENGEFHSFVYYAPYFSSAIGLEKGEVVHTHYQNQKDSAGFYFLDIYEQK